jgi:methanogenic corrinoid protein MtbC1
MQTTEQATDPRSNLIAAVADLDEDAALAIVRGRIQRAEDPFAIVDDCREGLRQVGERYERREYFIAGLIMAGEIFQEVMQLLEPDLSGEHPGPRLGVILLGTVAGDIHNIGKNIISLLLTSYGFNVYDLGVDVPAEEFLRKAREIQPDAIGLSGLITSSFESMKDTITLLRGPKAEGIAKIPIVIGGGSVDAQVCQFTGADRWANDAMLGVRIFKELLEAKAAS